MTTTAQSGSLMRLSAVLVFIGLPIILTGLGALNFIDAADAGLDAAEKRIQIATLAGRLAAAAKRDKPQNLSAVYVNGTSRSLASANLQQLLVDATSASSGHLIETSTIDPTDSDNPDAADVVEVRATLDIDNGGLLQLLYRLETGVPLLDVDTLSVRRLNESNGDKSKADMLRIDLAVKGRWKVKPA